MSPPARTCDRVILGGRRVRLNAFANYLTDRERRGRIRQCRVVLFDDARTRCSPSSNVPSEMATPSLTRRPRRAWLLRRWWA